MNWKPIIIIAATGGLAYGGYRFYQYLNEQKDLLQDYNVDLLKIKIPTLSENLVTIEFTLRITNKSVLEATIEKVYADVYLNNQYIGNISNDKKLLIPAKGSADAEEIKFTFVPKEVFKNAVSTFLTLITTKDIPYSMKGYVKLSSGGIGLSKTFDYTGSIKGDVLMMGSTTTPPLVK